MRKIVFLFVFFSVTIKCLGQTWSPPGATWTYSFIGTLYFGYVEIKYENDTIINSVNCQKLHKICTLSENFPISIFTIDRGYEYTYEDSGVVYLWYNNHFDTLYNFNSTIGDTWRMAKQPGPEVSIWCDSNSIVTVLDTGIISINNIDLKFRTLQFNYGTGWPIQTYVDTIIEKIGFIGDYMFPFNYCDELNDYNEGGAFRCYSDDNFPNYNPHYPNDCQFIVSVDENELSKVSLYPNPTPSTLTIQNASGLYHLSDITGKTLLSGTISATTFTLDISTLSSGVYFLTLLEGGQQVVSKVIKY